MSNRLIRWGKNDKQLLKRAVNNFNSKIRRLETGGRDNLPSKVSYKKLIGQGKSDEEILTRKELNQTLRSLRNFSKRGAENIITTAGGEELTKWEVHEIKLKQNRAEKRLRSEIFDLGFKRIFGMGNKEIQQKEQQIKSIRNLFNKRGYEFRRGYDALERVASPSKNLRDAFTWKENFMYALDELEGFENVDVLKEKLKGFKNPKDMWEYINQSETLKDLFLFYKEKATAQTYGGFKDNQEAFDKALMELGLNIWI